MGKLAFGAGGFLTFLLASGISHVWMPSGPFQVLVVLSFVASIFLLVGFGIATAVRRRVPRPALSAMLGTASAATFVALIVGASALGANPAESWMLLLVLPLLGGLADAVVPAEAGIQGFQGSSGRPGSPPSRG